MTPDQHEPQLPIPRPTKRDLLVAWAVAIIVPGVVAGLHLVYHLW